MKDLARALGVVLSILCMHSAGAARHYSSQTKRILVLGDSLSEGFGLRQSEAYPALLIDKLHAASLSFEVTNASASGGTTEGGLRRLPPHLKRKIDIFILELGINDAFRGVPIDKIRSNLQEIIDQVKAHNPNVRIIITGMQFPNYTADEYVFTFGKMFSELATKNHAALVPYLLEGVGGDPSLNLPDGDPSECSWPTHSRRKRLARARANRTRDSQRVCE